MRTVVVISEKKGRTHAQKLEGASGVLVCQVTLQKEEHAGIRRRRRKTRPKCDAVVESWRRLREEEISTRGTKEGREIMYAAFKPMCAR